MRFDKRLAPVKAAILPLSRNADLSPKAKDLATELRKNWNIEFDDAGAIGRRYRRQDEIGTPYCITVDFETLEDNAVTIRDRDTMDNAIVFAETGHLCLATLHANNANQAIDRIINLFPEERRTQVLMDLSLNLRGIVSQRLLPDQSGTGRVAAVEVMLNSPLISDMIFKGEVAAIREIIKRSREQGMQTFDQALFDLYEGNRISLADALRHADSVNDLRLNIKLNSRRGERDVYAGTESLGIV
jgi:hypothetical protein